jgi:polysaccharide export outer membrane protein
MKMKNPMLRYLARNLVWLTPAAALVLFAILFHAPDWSAIDRSVAPAPVPEATGVDSPSNYERLPDSGRTFKPAIPAGASRIPVYPEAIAVGRLSRDSQSGEVRLCQCLVPESPRRIDGVDCAGCGPCGEPGWNAQGPIPWQIFAQGEYTGPARTQHVPEYHIRVADILDFVYRRTRDENATPYKLNVGDTLKVESLTDPLLDRELVIQPDGTITLRLLDQVRAAGRTVDDLRQDIEERYKRFYKVPAITLTPMKVDTRLEDLVEAVNNPFSAGVQSRRVTVTPEGSVQLPGVGSVLIQGLTLDEVAREMNERYAAVVSGIEVTPVLFDRAPTHVFVLGEVKQPNRYILTGPTTAMQAIALAGGWNNGGNLREIVVFRRAEDWRLIATRLDVRGALLGKRPCPADEIWLRDSDLVVVPKMPILLADDFIELVFTKGIYGVFPFSAALGDLTTL